MEETKHNSQIEKIANMMMTDKISPDEQDIAKLKKYKELAKNECNLSDNNALKLVYEALLYMKLKNSDSVDPLQHGDQFGAGFS